MASSTTIKSLTLQQFLQLPETEPPQEFVDGVIIQKPMPKGKHSRLQGKLCNVINNLVEESRIAYAFPELRCSFAERSLIPDIAVFRWEKIPFLPDGEVPDRFELSPNWVIEILSPDQHPNKVIGKIIYCLEHGSELGWFIDPGDHSVLILSGDRPPRLIEGNQVLPTLDCIPLKLTANCLFDWLKMGQQRVKESN